RCWRACGGPDRCAAGAAQRPGDRPCSGLLHRHRPVLRLLPRPQGFPARPHRSPAAVGTPRGFAGGVPAGILGFSNGVRHMRFLVFLLLATTAMTATAQDEPASPTALVIHG